MSSASNFFISAESALSLLDSLLDVSDRQARRQQIPSLLELQTICRESGYDLPDLNTFAQVRDQRPALLLCGGTAEMATGVAKQVGYTLKLPDLPDAPLAWSADSASKAGLALRHGDAERTIKPQMLETVLQGESHLTDFVIIVQRAVVKTPWRFVWVPHPKYLEQLDRSSERLAILVGQQATITVTEDTPESVIRLLHRLEQKWWPISRDEWLEPKPRELLLSELLSLMQEPEETRELRSISLWHFVATRLLDELERRKHQYQITIDQQELKLKYVRQVLGQYQRNWTNGVKSLTDTYLQQRLAGKTITEFLDPQKAGPDVETFLNAIALPSLQGHIERFVTDRMAEFVSGLEGLAAKLELRRITLGEMNARWTPRTMGTRVESRLRERHIFAAGGGKRSGLVAGKTQGIVDQRKGQITHGSRELSQAINAEFSEWCTGFTTTFEQNIRIQLAAALANQGLADAEHLRGALSGFDRLSDRIRHHRDSVSTSEAIAAEWLRRMVSRRWIPLFQSR